MKGIQAFLASAALVLVAASGNAASERHIRVPLESNNNSGISGFVQVTQLPKGGSNVLMSIEGLQPDASYATFYYETDDCSAPADPLQSFTADKNGRAQVQSKIDEDIDELGSFSVRVGPEYGDLLACGHLHSRTGQ